MDTPNIITLDLTGCKYLRELHEKIREAFNFPDWYGRNWDAFWDLVRGTRNNTIVEIKGTSSLSAELEEEVKEMLKVLDDNKEELKNLKERRPQFDCRFDYRIID